VSGGRRAAANKLGGLLSKTLLSAEYGLEGRAEAWKKSGALDRMKLGTAMSLSVRYDLL
jgi:hypothetical protein